LGIEEGMTMAKERLQVPAYTDAWMMGDRFGELVKVTKRHYKAPSGHEYGREIAHVLMDKSGKVKRFILDDCTPVLP